MAIVRPMTAVIAMIGMMSFVLLGVVGNDQAVADDKPKEAPGKKYDAWMTVKLVSSQQVLAHLTAGDFKKMGESARRMQFVHHLEQWLRDEDFKNQSGYKAQLHAFEFATNELVRHADDKNMDGSLKSFQLMTESCVRCHQLLRDPVE